MLKISTDKIPPRERFDYWRDNFVRRHLGVEIEIEPERRHDFSGSGSAFAVGPATMLEGGATPHTLRTTHRTLDQHASDGNLYVWHLAESGGTVIAGDNTERVEAGTLMTVCGHTPGTFRPDLNWVGPRGPGSHCKHRGVLIPRSVLKDLSVAPGRLLTRQHRRAAGIDVLLYSYATTFFAQAPNLAGVDAEQAVRTLAQLSFAARGATDTREERASDAIREALRTRAHQLIEQELHQANLTPTRVAVQLGISVRKLHLVFEPGGTSFSRYVLARRIARADQLLREKPQMSVSQTAYASGFESLSTFFRCYKAAYGASPNERRAEIGSTRAGPV